MINKASRRARSIPALCLASSAIALAVPGAAWAQQAAAPVPGAPDSQEERTEDQTATGQIGVPDVAPVESPGPGNVVSTDEENTGEEIVVTGIRRGIADSISLKRNQDSIVEAVSAED